MQMRRLDQLLVVAVALAALAASAGPSALAATRRARVVQASCLSTGHRVVAANSRAVVYQTSNQFGQPEARGCVYGQRRSYRLGGLVQCGGGEEGCAGVDEETLAGTVVAYERYANKPCCQKVVVIVLDLRTGRVLSHTPSGVAASIFDVGRGFVEGLAVKSDGAVAWISDGGPARGGSQVHALDKTGNRVLASGTDVEPNSLALVGSTLYWTQASKAYSATLN